MALHKLQALQCLSVAFCDRLSTHAAAALLRRLPSLVHFDTTFCDAVDLRALRELLAVPCGDEGLAWRPCRRAPLLLVNECGSLLYGQVGAGRAWVRATATRLLFSCPGRCAVGNQGTALAAALVQMRQRNTCSLQEAAPFGEGDAIGMQHDHCCQGSLAHGPLRAL